MKGKKITIKNLVVLLVVAFTIISATTAYSSNKRQMRINYLNETWNTKDNFDLKWFINNKTTSNLKFEVDLSDFYDNKLISEDNELEIPFDVVAKVKDVNIDAINIIKINEEEVFNGKYEVSFNVPQGTDRDKIDISINIKEGNSFGITASESKDFKIAIDTIKPIISIDGIENKKDYEENKVATIKIDDTNKKTAEITLKIIKNEDEANPFTETYNGDEVISYEFNTDAHYKVIVNGKDKAGNIAEEKQIEFNINKTAPVIKFNDGELKEYYDEEKIIISVFDESKIDFSKSKYTLTNPNGTEVNNVFKKLSDNKGTEELNLDYEGIYNFSIKAVDILGKETRQSGSFIVDKTDPIITIDNVLDGQIYNNTVNSTIKIKEKNMESNNINITCNGKYIPINPLENTGDEYSTSNVFTEDGEYKIHVKAKDKIGHEKEKDITFKIDKLAPSIKVEGIENNGHYNNNKDVQVVIEDTNLKDNIIKTATIQVENGENNEVVDYDIGQFNSINANKKILRHTFKEEGKYTIKFKVEDLVGNVSEAEYSFIIDKEKPIVSISGIENNSFNDIGKQVLVEVNEKWYQDNNVTVNIEEELDSNDDSSIENILPEWNNTTDNIDIISSKVYKFNRDGKYKLEVKATDKAGNNSTVETIEFTIDKTAPKIEIIEGDVKDPPYYNSDRELTIKVNESNLENNILQVTKNGEEYNIGEFKKEGTLYELIHNFNEDGDYELKIKSKDKAGNENDRILNFTVDKTSPNIQIDGVDENEFYNTDKSINIKIDDINNNENNKVVIKKDGSEIINETLKNDGTIAEKTYNITETGSYNIKVISIDKAENESLKEINFTIDKIKPIITIKEKDKINNSYNKKLENIEVCIEERNFSRDLLKVNLKKILNNGEIQESIINIEELEEDGDLRKFTLSNLFNDEAIYELKIDFKDKAGNSSDTEVVKFTIDYTKPLIQVSNIEDKLHYKDEYRDAIFKINDVNNGKNVISILKDGEKIFESDKLELTGRDAILTYKFKDEGKYDVKIDSMDKAGNISSYRLSFIIDRTAPVITIQDYDNLNNSYFNVPKSVTVTVDELNWDYKDPMEGDIVKIEYTKILPNGEKRIFNPEFKTTGNRTSITYSSFSEDAIYTMVIKATDRAGNVATERKIVFTVDKVSPEIQITGVENDDYYNTDKLITIKNMDVNHNINNISITKNNEKYNSNDFNLNGREAIFNHKFAQEGLYIIKVESIDKAQNTKIAEIRFTIDKTAPVITPKIKGSDITIKDGDFINKIFSPEFKLDKPNDDNIDYIIINEDKINPLSTSILSEEKLYECKVQASDKAKNITNLDIKFTIDTTMPKVEIRDITSGFFNKDLAPSYEIDDTNINKDKSSVTLNDKEFISGTKISDEDYYNLKAIGTDLANNITEKNISFVIDKGKPKIIFKEAISGKYFTEDFIPNFVINDLTDYQVISMMLDGQDYEVGDTITKEGKHVLYIEVKDKAGNIETLTVEFILDKTAPKFLIDGMENNKVYYEVFTAKVKLDNPNDKFKKIIVNGKPAEGEIKEENGEQVLKLAFNEVQKYDVKLVAEDDAGNVTEESISFEVAEKSVLGEIITNKSSVGVIVIILVGTLIVISIGIRFVYKKKNSNRMEE